jgi:single-strand DNA-binding protein
VSIPTISDVAGVIAEPELRWTPSGKPVLNVRLAFNDSKFDETKREWVRTKTFYVDGEAWEQTAERLAEQLAQGDQVYVTGRLETKTWEDRDGGKRSKPVLHINTVRKLAKADAGVARVRPAQPADDPWAQPQTPGEVPF